MKYFRLLILSLIVVGCGDLITPKHSNSDGAENADNENAVIGFAEVKEKILVPFCIGCHANYADFASVKASVSQILNSVEKNRMPKNALPLTENLKTLLRQWIAEGANETIQTDTNNSDDGNIENPNELVATWTSISRNIFGPKCVVCHSPGGLAPWIDLTTRSGMANTLIKHINFKNPEESALIQRLKDPEEPMPPLPPISNLPQLTETEISVVQEWIRLGIP